MKKIGFIILALGLVVYMTGCGKKQQSLEEMQEPMSMEVLSMLNSTANTTAAATAESKTQMAPPASAAAKLEPLPPAGPYRPTGQEIQTALKNAGFYTGNVDGKLGPKTKKAIEEFQKANGLKADGKVGHKTWFLLAKHLAPQPAEASTPVTTVPPTKK